MKKVYLATPIEPAHHSKEEVLAYAEKVASYYESKGYSVYRPWKIHIPNAWDLPNYDWGCAVANEDIKAINECDKLVGIVYDRRESTAGTSWELGYAYGRGVPITIVEHESAKQLSLMIAATASTFYKGIENLKNDIKGSNTEVC